MTVVDTKTHWTVPALKELIDERDAEYKRRLLDLNHDHERAVEVQHTYVTAEKFDDFVAHTRTDKESVAKALTLAEGINVVNSRKQTVSTQWLLALFAFAGSFFVAMVGAFITVVVTFVVLLANGVI